MLKKIGLTLSKKEIENVVNMTPDAIEQVLLALKFHIEKALSSKMSFEGQSYMNPGMQFDQYGKENQQRNQNGGNMMYNMKPTGQLIDAEVLLEKDHTIS